MPQAAEVESAAERKLRSSTRNPRRRQRQSDNDTLKSNAPRRKRSKISEDTFQPRNSTEAAEEYDESDGFTGDTIIVANGHVIPQHANRHQRSHASNGKQRMNNDNTAMVLLGGDVELAVRGGKKGSIKRAVRGDGATVLTQNDSYSVKLLPSTPKELRGQGVEYRGSIGQGAAAALALAVTKERATVWDYASHVPSASQRVFDIPFQTKPDEPLPFALLVSSGAGNADIGLLILSAASSNVVYYESIDRAVSISLLQDRKLGVEGNIGHLFSGESVTNLIPADHVGYVVVLSSGRIAHLTLRDAQGKPKIACQYLRSADPNAGGLLGSIKGLWNGGLYMRNLSSVRVRPLGVRGQMQAVCLTERAEILQWDLDWSGRSEFKGTTSLRDALSAELKTLDTPELAEKSQSFTALDLAIVDNATPETGTEVMSSNRSQPLDMTVLLSTESAGVHSYFLAEVGIVRDEVFVTRIHSLRSYYGQFRSKKDQKPQLLMPQPGHTVYVVFNDAMVVVTSKESKLEGPDAQLSTALVPSITFEDTIMLRSDKDISIQSASNEETKGSQASCIAFVKSSGLVRVSAYDLSSASGTPHIPAKTKIEQAVFHGILQDNILDFSRPKDAEHDLIDTEAAVLAISDEILRASSVFVKPTHTSMEHHLVSKAQALRALVSHVRQNYPPLSQAVMWRLLWDAERIAAGQQLWATFEEHIAATSKGKRKATLLDELCAWFDNDENEQFPHRKDLASEDTVRRFFIAGLHRLEKLLGHTRTFLRHHRENLSAQSTMAPNDILQLVVQANDVWLRSLETVFAFRLEHAHEYGIKPDILQDGIIADPAAYDSLGEFWTSTEALVNACIKVASMSREFATKIFEKEEAMEEIDPLVREISLDNPRLIQLYCLLSQECINWRGSRPSERDQETARKLTVAFDTTRYDQFRALAEVGQVQAGMELAEKYRDMNTLTEMVVAEDQYLEESSKDPTLTDGERGVIVQSRHDLESKIRRYFDRYGEAWADAFFDMAFSGTAAGAMLTRAQLHWKAALTKYLQARPSRAKICWINDVMEESDFIHAGSVLAQAAKEQESRLWAKKVELSMSKLALLAAEEASQSTRALVRSSARTAAAPAQELIIADVQDRLYKHIYPEILASIDRQAELEICMLKFGKKSKRYSALRQLLEQGFSMVLDHTALSVEELIDVLTLMDNISNAEADGDLQHAEFYLALLALDAAADTLPPARFEMLLNLVWKRCFIYDDWATVKLTGRQSDEERQQTLRSTAVWHTYYHAMESGFFDRAECRVRAVAAKECIGSVCSYDELKHRFSNEDLLEPIIHDLRTQDELLTSYVTDRKLDDIVDECRRDARALLDEQADERAKMLAAEQATEEAFEKREKEVNGVNGMRTEEVNGFLANESDFIEEDTSMLS